MTTICLIHPGTGRLSSIGSSPILLNRRRLPVSLLAPLEPRFSVNRDDVARPDPDVEEARARVWKAAPTGKKMGRVVHPIVSTNRTAATIIGIVMRRISITVTNPLIEATTRDAYRDQPRRSKNRSTPSFIM